MNVFGLEVTILPYTDDIPATVGFPGPFRSGWTAGFEHSGSYAGTLAAMDLLARLPQDS